MTVTCCQPSVPAASRSKRPYMLLLTAIIVTNAQAQAPLKHPALLSFHEAVAQAWDQLPQRRSLAARQNAAAAQYQSGSALFPNAPSATGSYINDNAFGSANDFITSQVEVSTPIWLPGEGTATQRAARAQGEAAGAETEAAHLALASQVLELTARATLAENERDVTAQRLASARSLAADAAHRFHVGEGAESDALAADAEAASARVALIDDDGRVASARAALGVVLGADAIPRLGPAAGQARSSPNAPLHHPRIEAATRSLLAAQANARLVRIGNRDDPEIGVQGINEKQPGSPWDTRFGVVLRFSFASEARNAPRIAAAAEQVAQAEVQLEQARRQVLLEMRQADALLHGAKQAEADADRAARDQDRRRGMIERAWRAGEMSLIEVVRADALAFDASLAQAKGRTVLDAARLRLTLAEGVLP